MTPIRAENRARYPDNWRQISDAVRFVRAGGQCECTGECGRGTHDGLCPNVHGEPAYGTGSRVVLTTAHLDHTPENCEPENLRAMCQGCHLHYDRDHHAETRAATRAGRTGAVELAVMNAGRRMRAGLRNAGCRGTWPTTPDRTALPPRMSTGVAAASLARLRGLTRAAPTENARRPRLANDRLPPYG